MNSKNLGKGLLAVIAVLTLIGVLAGLAGVTSELLYWVLGLVTLGGVVGVYLVSKIRLKDRTQSLLTILVGGVLLFVQALLSGALTAMKLGGIGGTLSALIAGVAVASIIVGVSETLRGQLTPSSK